MIRVFVDQEGKKQSSGVRYIKSGTSSLLLVHDSLRLYMAVSSCDLE
jgi:hypothetical protein